MNIYKLYHKSSSFKSIIIKGTALEKLLVETNGIPSFAPCTDMEFQCTEGLYTDTPFIDGCIPVFSRKAINTLLPHIDVAVNPVRIVVDSVPFYLIDSIPIVSNSLDKEHSKIRYFRDGRIMNITDFVLKNREYPTIFRIEEFPSFVFVTEELIDVILKSDMSGLNWDLCKII